ncbi:MAG: ATP-binding protein [bacterium]
MTIFEQTVLLASLIVAVTSAFFGSLVYMNERNRLVNKVFFCITISVAVWIVAVLVETQGVSALISLYSSRVGLAAAVMIAFFVYRFSYHFSGDDKKFREHLVVISVITGVVFCLCLFTPFVLKEVQILQDGRQQNIYNFGVFIFGVYFITFIGLGFFLLISKFRRLRSETERRQILLIILGIILSASIAFTTNLILPALGFVGTLQFGPPSIIFFVGFSSYAILKHHLFNIRVLATAVFSFLFILFSIVHIPFMAPGTGTILSIFMFVIAVIAVGFVIRSAFDEIMQRKKLEQFAKKLEQANKDLLRLDTLRKEFFSFASHQLRQPLVIMKGYASLIYEGSYGEVAPEIKHASKKIEDAVDQLNLVVNNFLDIRSIEEGKMQYAFQVTDVVNIIRTVVADYKNVAESRKLALTFEASPEVIEGNVDPLKFKQVIQNLVDNSLKYTPTGYVHVSVTENDDHYIYITVSDSGIGMEESIIKILFQEFVRDKSAVKKGIRGTGLGLYFIKNIVESHKGEIWATSEGEGKGAQFHIKLLSCSDSNKGLKGK